MPRAPGGGRLSGTAPLFARLSPLNGVKDIAHALRCFMHLNGCLAKPSSFIFCFQSAPKGGRPQVHPIQIEPHQPATALGFPVKHSPQPPQRHAAALTFERRHDPKSPAL